MIYLIYNKSVCRTAPATLGLLVIAPFLCIWWILNLRLKKPQRTQLSDGVCCYCWFLDFHPENEVFSRKKVGLFRVLWNQVILVHMHIDMHIAPTI